MEEIEDDDYVPRTIEEAFAGSNGEEWRRAVAEELGMVEKMETWVLEDLPGGRSAIGCRWVFSKKRDEAGKVIRFKARLVAQGFGQKPGMDYDLDGTYAPVMRLETLRATLGLSAINKWHTYQLDVKNAYLNGDLDEEIFMKQPPGFDDGTNRVCKLKKSLYGLKQAGNVWNCKFNDAMHDFDFQQLKSEVQCLSKLINSNETNIQKAVACFNPSLVRNNNSDLQVSLSTSAMYNQLLSKAINA
jgi:hypothetical protein